MTSAPSMSCPSMSCPRSLLFVPADQPARMDKALQSGADALILDLEDSVTTGAKASARSHAKAFLLAHKNAKNLQIFVRINPLDTPEIDADLEAIMEAAPSAIILPKTNDGRDVTHLSVKLAAFEAIHHIAEGATRILAIASETPQSVFGLGTYANASPRLMGMTWGVEDLSACVGSTQTRNRTGEYTAPYQMVRTLALLGAAAAHVSAVDGIYAAFKDEEGLKRECEAAYRDGFVAKLAIHPVQIPIINAAFTPSNEALAHARAVISAFAATPDVGAIALDGKMLDRPHLVRAQRLLKSSRSRM
jgi:citrate lyase subunit beta / citryl-CoA lyase